MIIRISSEEDLRLEDDANFRAFKVVVDRQRAAFKKVRDSAPGVLRFEDASHAWVAIHALKRWRGKTMDAAWQASFDEMVTKAKPQGWISADDREIRAHVEWLPD